MHRIESNNFTTDDNGNFLFTDGPPGTTVEAAWLNSIQEEIANVIEQSGLRLQSKANDTRNQLYDALQNILVNTYDVVVTNQTQFNAIIERTAANTYKIKDEYTSVYLKYVAGGYQMSGASSPLSGGDVYGNLQTNLCQYILADSGTFIDFAATLGGLVVNTADITIFNLGVEGDAGSYVAGSIAAWTLQTAPRAKLYGCYAKNRAATVLFQGFYINGAIDSKLYGCYVSTCLSNANIYGFDGAFHLVNCYAADISTNSNNAAQSCRGFSSCSYISNSLLSNIESTGGLAKVYGAYGCGKITGGVYNNIAGTTGEVFGLYLTDYVSSLQIVAQSSSGACYGVHTCGKVSGCDISADASTTGNVFVVHTSEEISSCTILNCSSNSGTVTGIYNSKQITGISIYNLTTSGVIKGMDTCDNISGCKINKLTSSAAAVTGMDTCNQITSCEITDLDGGSGTTIYGMKACNQISGCKIYTLDVTAGNGTIIGMDNCAAISSCYLYDFDLVGTNSLYGMNQCTSVSSCNLYDFANTASSGTIYGMKSCTNVTGCNLNQFDAFSTGYIFAMDSCVNVSGCHIYDMDTVGSNSLYGMYNCLVISSCTIFALTNTGSSGNVVGLSGCSRVSGVSVYDIDANSGLAHAFNTCGQVSGCQAYDIASVSGTNAMGFATCTQVSGCNALTIDGGFTKEAYGFHTCEPIVGCTASDIDAGLTANGFRLCFAIAGCVASDVDSVSGTAMGFQSCQYGAAVYTAEATNTGNDWIDTVDVSVTNKVSTPSNWT